MLKSILTRVPLVRSLIDDSRQSNLVFKVAPDYLIMVDACLDKGQLSFSCPFPCRLPFLSLLLDHL